MLLTSDSTNVKILQVSQSFQLRPDVPKKPGRVLCCYPCLTQPTSFKTQQLECKARTCSEQQPRSSLLSRWASWSDMRPLQETYCAAHVRFNESKDSSFTKRPFAPTNPQGLKKLRRVLCYPYLTQPMWGFFKLPRTRVKSKTFHERWMNWPMHVRSQTTVQRMRPRCQDFQVFLKALQDRNLKKIKLLIKKWYIHEKWWVPEILVVVPSYGYNIWHENKFIGWLVW